MILRKSKTSKNKTSRIKKVVLKEKNQETETAKVKEEATNLKEIKAESSYLEGVGRRKTSVARVRIVKSTSPEFLINGKELNSYFALKECQMEAMAPLEKLGLKNDFKVSVLVKGGGWHSQAIAVRHGLSRALAKINEDFRKKLRQFGYLTRDPRMRERKKFGLKRARRAPQWQKR
jgi:small subunit ribosomal protein S9